jgi:2-oxoglutarate ferredoxin oxidoreductase subunit beta
MLKDFRDNSIPLSATEKLPPDKIEGKIIRGILRKEIRPEFTAEYTALCKKIQTAGGE